MPTLPSEQEPHRHREIAESFGVDAQRYDRARPSYPAGLIAAVMAASPGPDLLDVGCGTGIATEQFRAAGAVVLGVEVDPRMAAVARNRGLAVEVDAFEDWDPAGRTFDAVVAGQAWHWIDLDVGPARAAAALRPGGVLALFWNVFQPAPAIAGRFAEVYQRVLPESPVNLWASDPLDTYNLILDKVTGGIRRTGAFGEPEQSRFDWSRTYTRDEWVEQVSTFGGHNLLPQDKLAELRAGLGAAVDAVGGSFTMDYAALTALARRSSS